MSFSSVDIEEAFMAGFVSSWEGQNGEYGDYTIAGKAMDEYMIGDEFFMEWLGKNHPSFYKPNNTKVQKEFLKNMLATRNG